MLVGIAALNVAIGWKWNNVQQCHEHEHEDDLSVEFRSSTIERRSIRIALDGIMVLDLVRIASDLELEPRIRIIDHLDRVHTTDRIKWNLHRHSVALDQRSCSIERELHVELHCCSIVLVDSISVIDDLVRISVIVIDEDDLGLEQWNRIAACLSIRIICIRIMVLDLVRIASNLELEPRIRIIDHLDRVHASNRIKSIDTIH